MGERLKRLIAALLVTSMAVMPGMTALADEEPAAEETVVSQTAEEAEATAVPETEDEAEAAEEPEAEEEDEEDAEVTPTPAVTAQPTAAVASPADSDEYYQEAAGFLKYLEIMVGDEKGDLKPEETITRAEITAIILRETNVPNRTEYQDIFEDVDDSHWAADDIQTAYEAGIIDGYGDGAFGPDDDVTYEQVVKMIVCAIGWGSRAELQGGYPQGYIREAIQRDITDNAQGVIGEEATRRTVAKLVYNSLTADYPVVAGSSLSRAGVPQINYETRDGVTILSETRDIYWQEGIITAAPDKAVGTSISLTDHQIMVEDEVMESEIENPEQYVAEYARVYYRDLDGDGSDKTAVYIIPLTNKTETMIIDADDIDSIVTGYAGGTAEIKYKEGSGRSTKRLKLINQPSISYNNQPFTLANFQALGRNDITFDEFVTPAEGSVRAVDFNKDGAYDVLFVDSYETSVVNTVTSTRLQLEYPVFGDQMEFKLDPDNDNRLTLKVYRDEEPCNLRDLQVGDIVSIKANANFTDKSYTGDKTIIIEASVDYAEGVLDGISGEYGDDEIIATIDGDDYDVINNEDVISDLKSSLGVRAKYRLNIFGSVSYVEGGGLSGLASGEKYGWLINVYADDSGDGVIASLYTTDNGIQNISLNSSVDYWDPTMSSAARTSDKIIDSYIENSTSSGGHFLTCTATDYDDKASIRLCKYKINSSGKINKLYLAVDSSTVSEKSNALRLDTKDLKGAIQKGGLFDGKYYIEKGVPQITAPITLSENRVAGNYGYRISDHEDFTRVSTDTGITYNCYFGDVEDSAPGVIIRFTKSTSEAQDIEDYSTADDNKIIVISKIGTGVDENGDDIYTIKGRIDGQERDFTLANNVLVAQVNEDPWAGNNKSYSATTIWTNADSRKLTEVLHKGDICGIAGSNNDVGIVLRMVDMQGMAAYFRGGAGGDGAPQSQFFRDEMFSSSRDRIIFGEVVSKQTKPIVQLGLKNRGSYDGNDLKDDADDEATLYVGLSDVTRVVQLITIGKSSVTINTDESDAYDIEAGDYVFMRNYRNDTSREMYIIRYEG